MEKIFKCEYKGILFEYIEENEGSGLLTIVLKNGVKSNHSIKNWDIIRVMQYIESMTNLF